MVSARNGTCTSHNARNMNVHRFVRLASSLLVNEARAEALDLDARSGLLLDVFNENTLGERGVSLTLEIKQWLCT